MAKFTKGHQLATGRPKGSLNEITRTFKDGLTEAYNELQKDPNTSLIGWGKKNLNAFYLIASKLIPTEINHSLDNKVINVVVPLPPGEISGLPNMAPGFVRI